MTRCELPTGAISMRNSSSACQAPRAASGPSRVSCHAVNAVQPHRQLNRIVIGEGQRKQRLSLLERQAQRLGLVSARITEGLMTIIDQIVCVE